jgi:GNAT superfamily N-acetyltransferase
MRIRPGTAVDADAMTDVARRAKASWGYPAEWLREWEPILSFSPEYIESHPTFVVEMGGDVVGVAVLETDPTPELAHLWVAPGSQGKGVGRVLLGHVGVYAARAGWSDLRIESDPNAVAFYERAGALIVGEVSAPVCGLDRRLPILRLPVAGLATPDGAD